MKGSDTRPPETFTFDFAKRRFPVWFRPEESTRQAAVVSYMHAHQLSLTRVYAKAGCSRHFCVYRFVTYDDPAAIPGPVESCGWIDVGGPEPGCRLPQGFVYRPGRAIPILQAAFDRTPEPATPIGRDPRAPLFGGKRNGGGSLPHFVGGGTAPALLSLQPPRLYRGRPDARGGDRGQLCRLEPRKAFQADPRYRLERSRARSRRGGLLPHHLQPQRSLGAFRALRGDL